MHTIGLESLYVYTALYFVVLFLFDLTIPPLAFLSNKLPELMRCHPFTLLQCGLCLIRDFTDYNESGSHTH